MIAPPSTNGHHDAAAELRRERERALLSGCFGDEQYLDRLVGLGLQPDMLTDDRCREVFSTLKTLRQHGDSLTPLAVGDYISRHGDLIERLGPDWLTWLCGLCDGLPLTSADYIARQIVDEHQRRRLRLQTEIVLQRLSDPAEDVASIVTSLQGLGDDVQTTAEISAMTSAELDAGDFPQNYMVAGVLLEGQPCICAAPKKSLKTNIMIDLTLSLSSGSKFLNEFHVPREYTTALISGESGRATIQETARRIARSKPWKWLKDYPRALWGFDLPVFNDDKSMLALKRFIRRNRVEVLTVDPAYLSIAVGDDAGNLFKMGQALLPFSKLTSDEGVTPIIVHHFTKAGATSNEPPEMESISWSGFQEWMRQWLLLSRRSKYNPDQPGHHELWMVAGGSGGHSLAKALDIDEGHRDDPSGRRWDVSIASIGEAVSAKAEAAETVKEQRLEAKATRQRERDVEKLRQRLKEHPNGLTFTELRTLAISKDERLHDALKVLKDGKEIEECEITKANKQTYPAVRLRSPATPAPTSDVAGVTDGHH